MGGKMGPIPFENRPEEDPGDVVADDYKPWSNGPASSRKCMQALAKRSRK